MAAFTHDDLRVLVLWNLTENFENGILVLFLNAFALVVDNKNNLFVFFIVLDMNINSSTIICVIDSVLNNVVCNLLKSVRVTNHMPW